MAYAEELNPRRTYFTHICHELPHARTEGALPPHIRLAYDGLEIAVEEPRCPSGHSRLSQPERPRGLRTVRP